MAGLIPQTFIDDLVSETEIVEVIEQYVPLKRAGKEYQACCPFHEEKTPSFTVVPDKQFYHCFGCGAHGTAVGFLMEYANMEFVEAVEELARRAGRDIPREGPSGHRPRDDLGPVFAALGQANAYFQRQLRKHPLATRRWHISRSEACRGRSPPNSSSASRRPDGTGCFETSARTSKPARR